MYLFSLYFNGFQIKAKPLMEDCDWSEAHSVPSCAVNLQVTPGMVPATLFSIMIELVVFRLEFV